MPIEYPRHLHKPGGLYLLVANEQEQAAGLAAGWRLDVPIYGCDPPPVEKPKRGPGRPRKIVTTAA